MNIYVTESVSSSLTVYDGNGVAGTYGWQVEVFTVQNVPAFQWAMMVKNYKTEDFFLEVLTGGPNGYDGYHNYPTSNYYPAQPNYKFQFYGGYSYPGNYLASMNIDVYINGVYSTTYITNVPSKYQGAPQQFQSVLVGHDAADPLANFVGGAGSFTYYSPLGPITGTTQNCPGVTWSTGENSNMMYGSLSCGTNTCTQNYNAPSWSIKSGYFVNPQNGQSWNNQVITKTGTNWLDGTINPSCPSYVSVTISGSTSTDPYQRSLSVTFNDGFGTDTLLSNKIVSSSFNFQFNIPQTYINMRNSPAHLKFQLTTYVGSWTITESTTYQSQSSCV